MIKYEVPIPLNTEDGTGFFGGTVKIRNLIEMIAGILVIIFLSKILLGFLKYKVRLILTLVLCFLASVFFLVGINQMSFTQYIALLIHFSMGKSVATLGMPKKEEK